MAFHILLPLVILTLLITVHFFVRERAIVAGKIFDKDRQPLDGAQVRIGAAITYTDSSGQFQIPDVPFGRHLMSLRRGPIVKERPIEIRKHSLVIYETVG